MAQSLYKYVPMFDGFNIPQRRVIQKIMTSTKRTRTVSIGIPKVKLLKAIQSGMKGCPEKDACHILTDMMNKIPSFHVLIIGANGRSWSIHPIMASAENEGGFMGNFAKNEVIVQLNPRWVALMRLEFLNRNS